MYCSVPITGPGDVVEGISPLTECSFVDSRDSNAQCNNSSARPNTLGVGSCGHRHIANNMALDLTGPFVSSVHVGCRGCFCHGNNVTGASRGSGVIIRFVAGF